MEKVKVGRVKVGSDIVKAGRVNLPLLKGEDGKDGIDGKDYIITEKDKQDIVSDVKTDLQPFLYEVKDTSDTALSIAKGANQSLVFNDYAEMINEISKLSNNKQVVGQNILIVTLNVPDLWISEISDVFIPYTYISDEELIKNLKENVSVQIGYYKFSALETQKVDLTEYVTLEKFNEEIGNIASLLDTINGEVI